jgi:hypothetical protein
VWVWISSPWFCCSKLVSAFKLTRQCSSIPDFRQDILKYFHSICTYFYKLFHGGKHSFVCLQINFNPQQTEDEFDVGDHMQFWESTREWFMCRGYRLYKMPPFQPPFIQNSLSMPNYDRIGGKYPYAFHDPGTGLDDCLNSSGRLQPSYSVNSAVLYPLLSTFHKWSCVCLLGTCHLRAGPPKPACCDEIGGTRYRRGSHLSAYPRWMSLEARKWRPGRMCTWRGSRAFNWLD